MDAFAPAFDLGIEPFVVGRRAGPLHVTHLLASETGTGEWSVMADATPLCQLVIGKRVRLLAASLEEAVAFPLWSGGQGNEVGGIRLSSEESHEQFCVSSGSV